MKRILCISAIFLLILLILFPPYLRRYVNFDTKKIETIGKNDTINVINCKRDIDEINTSYLNGKTYNIQYKVKGNYVDTSEKLENNLEETDNQKENDDNMIHENLKKYAKASYDLNKDITTYRLNINESINQNINLKDYLLPINDEIKYYQNLGYNCSSLNL